MSDTQLIRFLADAHMSAGEAVFAHSHEGSQALLKWWAGLADRSEYVWPPVPTGADSLHAVRRWARAILHSSAEWEGSWAPKARVYGHFQGERLQHVVLAWQGTFTPDRWVEVTLYRTTMRLAWDSGTGCESSFLGIQDLVDAVTGRTKSTRKGFLSVLLGRAARLEEALYL